MSKQQKSSRETMISRHKNMYPNSVKQWNVFVGCYFDCTYCKPSFQKQMKRRKNDCEKCYKYSPHFHKDRLDDSLPKTKDDEFIWVASSSDIWFMKPNDMRKVLARVGEMPDRNFFFQSKNANVFFKYDFPVNCMLGITLETNIDDDYALISKAPRPTDRFLRFLEFIKHDKGRHKYIVTVEPIMKFNLNPFVDMLRRLDLFCVNIGVDTKKCGLHEPTLPEILNLIKRLKHFTQVREKLIYRPDLLNAGTLDKYMRRGLIE